MDEVRARRATVFILLVLTIIVFLRAISTARGATFDEARVQTVLQADSLVPPPDQVGLQVEEPATLLEAGSRVHRTLVLSGLPAGTVDIGLNWRALLGNQEIARGRHPVVSRSGGEARFVVSIPIPPIDRPTGLDLEVLVLNAGRRVGGRSFPFTVYPAPRARDLLALFGSARVAVYDPRNTAFPILRSLGLAPTAFDRIEEITLYDGQLLVIGPRGFVRGHEGLGPILAAQARAGMRVLLLDQPNLPGTLSEDLRLWPAFHSPPETEVVIDSRHPILSGLEVDRNLFSGGGTRSRPLLPPTRGNFRVLAELRVRSGPAWQQGVTLLEYPMGAGTVLASQLAIPTLYRSNASARILMINALAYLLEVRTRPARAHLYGEDIDDLPACLARLDPRLPKAPRDLSDVEVLLAPADWRAPRRRNAAELPLLSQVARFLRDGGTLILINPQPLVQEYLRRLTGTAVQFREVEPGTIDGDLSSNELLRGVAPVDLGILARTGRAELRLLKRPGPDGIRPILLASGLVEYRVGQGRLVALSLPDVDDCKPSRASSMLARLLTNLEIPLHQSPGVDLYAITLLNK